MGGGAFQDRVDHAGVTMQGHVDNTFIQGRMKAFVFFIISTAQHLGVVLQPLSQPFVFHLALQGMILFVVEYLERIIVYLNATRLVEYNQVVRPTVTSFIFSATISASRSCKARST